MKKISVVVPVYKEENSIRPFLARIEPILQTIGDYEIIFCLDPSPDRTEEVIGVEISRNPNIGLLVFSRRFGQPAATLAGISHARGECCVVIDVDLQDPPELITELYAKYTEGYDVAYARRRSRVGETWFKIFTTHWGYKFINHISDVAIPRNTGDFRILSRRAMEALKNLRERHGFLRGMVAFVGYKQTFVEYDRDARFADEGKYNRFWGSLRIALNGVFGFSTYPLSFIMWFGFAMAAISFIAIMMVFVGKFILHQDYPLGIPTITVLVLFMGGVQLAAIGVLGEYIGRIYEEVRDRPLYIVDRAYNVGDDTRFVASPARQAA